jgi:hypothetical protein
MEHPNNWNAMLHHRSVLGLSVEDETGRRTNDEVAKLKTCCKKEVMWGRRSGLIFLKVGRGRCKNL